MGSYEIPGWDLYDMLQNKNWSILLWWNVNEIPSESWCLSMLTLLKRYLLFHMTHLQLKHNGNVMGCRSINGHLVTWFIEKSPHYRLPRPIKFYRAIKWHSKLPIMLPKFVQRAVWSWKQFSYFLFKVTLYRRTKYSITLTFNSDCDEVAYNCWKMSRL